MSRISGSCCALVVICLLDAIMLPVAVAAAPAFVDTQTVSFESAAFTYKPSPLKVRQASKLGKPVEVRTEPAVSISGYLARPESELPAPAVVLLHTCAGISEHEQSWSERLVSWGYVVLSVDSFSPRGVEYLCDGRAGPIATPWIRALDAFGAKQYLSAQPFVDPRRIAVMGMSHGGMTVLEAIKQSTGEGLEVSPFQAAIALYPLCSAASPVNTAVLIVVGDLDLWTPVAPCQQYLDGSVPEFDVRLSILEAAYHGFDHPDIDTVELGYVIRSNSQATTEASALIRSFLEEQL